MQYWEVDYKTDDADEDLITSIHPTIIENWEAILAESHPNQDGPWLSEPASMDIKTLGGLTVTLAYRTIFGIQGEDGVEVMLIRSKDAHIPNTVRQIFEMERKQFRDTNP